MDIVKNIRDSIMFQTFKEFKEYTQKCTKDENLSVKTIDNHPNSIMLENIQEANPVLLLEIVLWAYDSQFHLGGFHANKGNGSLLIYV